MKSKTVLKVLGFYVIIFGATLLVARYVQPNQKEETASSTSVSSSVASAISSTSSEEEAPQLAPRTPKTAEEKQLVMTADAETMDALGLHYDYANMTLPQVVQTYLDEAGIDHASIAFSYKDLRSGETASMNDTQPMRAGSTYKLPLNMLVVDEVDQGHFNLTDRYDINQTYYEFQGEHDNYVAAFDGAMSIPDMQEYSLVYSENTPAYALADRLGGIEKAYSMYDRYGQGKGELKTFNSENRTTTDYYIQVLDYLWKHQEKYKDLLHYIGESFPDEYYKRYVKGITIYQKPGYVGEALNVDAIVMEESPYLIALYTSGLGGSTPESEEVSGVGIDQVGQLAYIINEWHRVNMN